MSSYTLLLPCMLIIEIQHYHLAPILDSGATPCWTWQNLILSYATYILKIIQNPRDCYIRYFLSIFTLAYRRVYTKIYFISSLHNGLIYAPDFPYINIILSLNLQHTEPTTFLCFHPLHILWLQPLN